MDEIVNPLLFNFSNQGDFNQGDMERGKQEKKTRGGREDNELILSESEDVEVEGVKVSRRQASRWVGVVSRLSSQAQRTIGIWLIITGKCSFSAQWNHV